RTRTSSGRLGLLGALLRRFELSETQHEGSATPGGGSRNLAPSATAIVHATGHQQVMDAALRALRRIRRTRAQKIAPWMHKTEDFLRKVEAPPGFEPGVEVLQTSALPLGDGASQEKLAGLKRPAEDRGKGWSGKRDSNPRLRPWQGRTLPLSYSRSNLQSTIRAAPNATP